MASNTRSKRVAAVPSTKPVVTNQKRATTRTKAVKSTTTKSKLNSKNLEVQEESTDHFKMELRNKSKKNYCEMSRLSQTISSNSKKSDNNEPTESNKIENGKNVPIYKTLRLSQEKVADKEEIYDFPDDSQENINAGKKRRRPVKKSAVKQTRKVGISKTKVPQKKQKKVVKKEPSIPKKSTKIPIETNEVDCAPIDEETIILQNDEDAVANKAVPAVKIVSNQKLEGSKRINLMSTPYVPKTITSDLKLYGPTNAITFQPTSHYNKMANHSLIRKSMSPITKTVDEFDTGSPWRPTDTFSRIKNVIQSTPQIKRPLLNREKKIIPPVHISEKSICSANTILISSTANNESPEKTPKKLLTGISNSSSSPSKSSENIYEAKTILQSHKRSPLQAVSLQTTISENNHISPAKALSPRSSFPQGSINQATPENSAISNKENIEPISNEIIKDKISSPKPVRSETMKTSSRLASIESHSKELNANDEPTENKKTETTKLKQSNLKRFLNLDEMPESTQISTAHGIFDDISSTPINSKKTKKGTAEPNIENAFGFDDSETTDNISTVENTSGSKIATIEDVKKSVKGKLFPKARVKSALPSRISSITRKKALLKNVLQQQETEKAQSFIAEETNEETTEKSSDENTKSYDEPEIQKKALLDAVSFSDTFDVLSENGDLESKIPDEVPLFVDMEPVHFSKPPRRSYNKRKREATYDYHKDYANDDDSDYDEIERKRPKTKKKKESKLSKEDQKRMQAWVKSINSTFEEIENFDLVVE